MTRLYLLVDELQTAGRTPAAVRFSNEDEELLMIGAEETFGAVGAASARRGPEAFREFLRAWVGRATGATVTFGADQTRVS